MAQDVFISYSHQDKSIADALCAALEDAGAPCWIAHRDIAPGLDWPTAISNAIAASRILLLVFSAHSNASKEVSRELSLASSSNLIILPFKIDHSAPEPGKQYYLARTHWFQAANPPTPEHIDSIVRYVTAFLVDQAAPATAQTAAPVQASRHNLPAHLTSFIGRQKEMAEIRQLVVEHRLVTLVGPGGTGKSRLALEVAPDLLSDFPMGLWLVELAPLAQPALVPAAITAALKLKEDPSRPTLDILTEYLRTKKILLILDNCEHLVEACAQAAESLLRACADLHILASSREALNIAGETIFHVPALTSPAAGAVDQLDNLIQYEAVQLFTERAAAVQPGFSLTTRNAPAVALICQRLDGIPLALELAAARMNALSVKQIAARLDDCFRLLTSGSRTALPRQKTLRAMIDWSHDLLSEPEQVLFRRLSVFAGSCNLKAVEQVTSSVPLYEAVILDLLTGLVDKSLVIAEERKGEARYRMLETIQQYGSEKLLGAGEKEQMLDRHLGYFLELAEQANVHFRGAEARAWFDRLDAELDNLRHVQAWVLDSQNVEAGLRLAGTLPRFWNQRSYLNEGIEWSEKMLALEAAKGMPSPTNSFLAVKAHALCEIAFLNFCACWLKKDIPVDLNRVRTLSKASQAIYEQLDDQRGKAMALYNLAALNMFQNKLDEAQAAGKESLRLSKAVKDTWLIAEVLNGLGITAAVLGNYEKAKEYQMEGLALRREIGDKDGAAWALFLLGIGSLSQGHYAEAAGYLEEALPLAREVDNIHMVGITMSRLGSALLGQGNDQLAEHYLKEGLKLELTSREHSVMCLFEMGGLAGARKQWERSARLLGAVDVYLGSALPLVVGLGARERYVAEARTHLDEAAFAAAWSAGQAMTLEEAVAFALEETLS
jgi:predicted ATPase